MDDVRWKQRLQNFGKAFNHLKSAIQINNPDIVQKAGIIQFFEMSFELAWNTMKDYLQDQGYPDIKSPKESIKKAFEIGLIDNGHQWLKILEDRNLTSHAYDEITATEIALLIRRTYFPLFEQLITTLQAKSNE